MTARVVADEEEGRAEAIRALRGGGIVGLPTDTVYGIAVDPGRAGAVELLYAAKGRPPDRQIAVLCADAAQAVDLGEMPPPAKALAACFWPGGLTLVLRVRPGAIPPAFPVGIETLGVRVPAHPSPRALAAELGPLPTTSANRSGEPEATDAQAIVTILGHAVSLVLDGGRSSGGPASTVVDCSSDQVRVLRAGTIAVEAVEACLRAAGLAGLRSPG
jgi:L-threonylcarbamoyladenylate synthase